MQTEELRILLSRDHKKEPLDAVEIEYIESNYTQALNKPPEVKEVKKEILISQDNAGELEKFVTQKDEEIAELKAHIEVIAGESMSNFNYAKECEDKNVGISTERNRVATDCQKTSDHNKKLAAELKQQLSIVSVSNAKLMQQGEYIKQLESRLKESHGHLTESQNKIKALVSHGTKIEAQLKEASEKVKALVIHGTKLESTIKNQETKDESV